MQPYRLLMTLRENFRISKLIYRKLVTLFWLKGINTLTKIILHFRRNGLERLTFCNKFDENRWIGFVDMAMFVFLSVVEAILIDTHNV